MSTHILNGQKSSVTSHSDSNKKTSSYYPAATAKYENVAQISDLFWATLKAFHKSLGLPGDKGRYKSEMLGYKSSYDSPVQ